VLNFIFFMDIFRLGLEMNFLEFWIENLNFEQSEVPPTRSGVNFQIFSLSFSNSPHKIRPRRDFSEKKFFRPKIGGNSGKNGLNPILRGFFEFSEKHPK
jgi:hypothetical protein